MTRATGRGDPGPGPAAAVVPSRDGRATPVRAPPEAWTPG